MAKEHILVIEDEQDIQELLRYNLSSEGYTVTCVSSGEEGLQKARAISPDLILLDRMLPNMEGLDVCRELKKDTSTEDIPVIMLTAKGEEADIISGLEMGADDYIPKPFSPKVVIARVRAVLRREKTPEAPADVLRRGDLVINPGKHEVTINNDQVALTITEFKILHLLARKPGWVFNRDQIVDSVHGENYAVTDRSVDVQITGLRKKLGVSSALIETVRGVGYRFKEL
ncbi:MAG: response regulator transcription factor [Deltaproteobacteria bacterium]|nr:response regulator transcription factor [Deltaproteobacteria bacterium]